MNYYSKFIDFFKKNNLYNANTFNYLRDNSIMFDYIDDDARDFIGCNYIVANKKLIKISLVVPFFDSNLTTLINIHEYVHGIMLYKYLGKKYIAGNDCEMLPMLYERLYFLDNPTDTLTKYEDMYDNAISSNSDLKYRIGLKYRDELIEKYKAGYDFNSLDKHAKKLAIKHK